MTGAGSFLVAFVVSGSKDKRLVIVHFVAAFLALLRPDFFDELPRFHGVA